MTITIGKTYRCRDGSTFTATGTTNYGRTYRIVGRDERDRVSWRSAKGRFTRHPHPKDIADEVH